jgi:hypothetical protein
MAFQIPSTGRAILSSRVTVGHPFAARRIEV